MRQPIAFSQREKEVISLLLEGKSNKQIALVLGISIRTVEFHLGNIYARLQVSSRSEAIVKLSNDQLWKSTGSSSRDDLRESTVEFEDKFIQNKGKRLDSARKPLMKIMLYLGTGLVAIYLVIGFFLLPKISQQISITSTHTPNNSSPTSSSTLSPREQIVTEACRLGAEYDQAVKAEIQKGEVEISKDPQSGQEIILFEGNSRGTIWRRYDELNEQLQALNEQYLLLYVADVRPTPFPTKSTEKENGEYYQELLEQHSAFFDQLLEEGPAVVVYDPGDGLYYTRLIGDAHAKSEIMTDAMETLRLAPQMAKVDQAAQIAHIRAVLDQPDLQLTFEGLQGLANAPWINAAIYTDEMGIKYWVAIDAGRLAQIEPASHVNIPAVEVRSIETVRPIAEQFAFDNSPRFAQLKDDLLYEEGSKGDIYFFHWDERNKDWTDTDWAMMPPFLQIGLSADGKIVTYINTLDLYNGRSPQ